jgi:hypothetical protein
MNKYSKLVVVFIGIWFTASVMNGILSGIFILSTGNETSVFIIPFIVVLSFIFSIPFIFITLIITGFLLSVKAGENIFRTVLPVSFFVSIAGSLFFKGMFDEFDKASTLLCVSVVVSSVTVVMIFRNKLKAINNN